MHHTWTNVDGNWQRWYRTDDNAYPGCTAVLSSTDDSSGLEIWRRNVGERWANAWTQTAIDNGTHIHNLIEDLLKGGISPAEFSHPWIGPHGMGMLSDLMQAKDLQAERRTFWTDGEIGFAGTCDVFIPSESLVIDWKTHRKHIAPSARPKYHLQVAAYAKALGAENGAIVTWLPKDEHLHWDVDVAKGWEQYVERLRAYWSTDEAKQRREQAMTEKTKAKREDLDRLLDMISERMPHAVNKRGLWTARFFDACEIDRGSPSTDDIDRAIHLLQDGYGLNGTKEK